MDGGTEHKYNKTRYRVRGKAFMVLPAGFEPATPGLEEPHFGVSGVFQMRCNPYISAITGFRSIYAVAPKTPIPSLRGDAVVTDARFDPVASRPTLRLMVLH